MELRALRYYLAVCEWGTMSRAAEELHVTQPALSRQIAALERELGCELLERHSRSVRPTEKGLYLRRRAQEIVGLADQTSADFSHGDEIVAGDIHIGAGESASMRLIAQRVRAFRRLYPDVRFHLHSAVATDLMERLEHGLDDLVVLMSYPNDERCSHLRLPLSDAWGVAMRADDPLASREVITPADLTEGPLIMPERSWAGERLAGPLGAWFGDDGEAIEVAATYNLSFNATLLVQEGVGRMLTLEGLTPSEPGSGLAFRLLYPPAVSIIDVVWKRGATPSRAVSLFLESLREG
ncbi:LysR family transcriptional regulator [Thermophilibacter mediterraneus]|uniref:LysR family transcriptional regulator n=1 Tax=Thermophilibacter mediterraneus TaxID=1871031 RepID=UPI0023553FD2|nr:LysR family transcriptional regulator [Thermophilibacter mediterraneus]